MKKPFQVLCDPASGRGVAYDAGHRLMGDEASAELVAFALDRHVRMAPWAVWADYPLERPLWVATGPLQGWVLYWLRDGQSSAQHLRDTPDR